MFLNLLYRTTEKFSTIYSHKNLNNWHWPFKVYCIWPLQKVQKLFNSVEGHPLFSTFQILSKYFTSPPSQSPRTGPELGTSPNDTTTQRLNIYIYHHFSNHSIYATENSTLVIVQTIPTLSVPHIDKQYIR